LFQNAIDQESVNPENKMSYSYNEPTLCINSKASVLERNSLLFGSSSKQADEDTIGKFGEGYKLAMMVLLRGGFEVTVFNYEKREIWIPSMQYSEIFEQNVLSIEIKEWNCPEIFDVPANTLSFQIMGITPEHMEKITETNLHIPRAITLMDADQGKILTDEDQQARLYVNGLFVETSKTKLTYGYNFHPRYIALNRDRRTIDSFELTWLTSQMWAQSKEYGLILAMLKDNAKDVESIPYHIYKDCHLSGYALKQFREEHGENAVPVVSQEEYDLILAFGLYKPVFCPEALKKIIYYSSEFSAPVDPRPGRPSVKETIRKKLLTGRGLVKPNIEKRIIELLKISEKWGWK